MKPCCLCGQQEQALGIKEWKVSLCSNCYYSIECLFGSTQGDVLMKDFINAIFEAGRMSVIGVLEDDREGE